MHVKTRTLLFTALFAALTAVGAFLKIPLGHSSITLQFLFTAMAGILLGRRWGALSQLVYVLVGLVGVPVFTMGGGLGYVLQPTFGFLLGLIPCAWLIGWMSRRRTGAVWLAASCAAGLGALYLVGLPYMALILNGYMGKGMDLSALLWAGMLPFLPGDALKIAAAAAVCPTLQKRLCNFDEFRR
ncbi:MAG: biotin transporter BioY [Oscillospiraceae bacterium]|nr:biotin transporter BioY [Oscillospiraceae bacterium]